MKKIMIPILFLFLMIALAACSAGGDTIPQTGEGTDVPGLLTTPVLDQQVITNVQNFLSEQLNISADQVTLGTPTYMEWPDSCLGLGQANESCAAMVTPGYSVTATVNGQTYEVRTNKDGSVVRMAGDAGTDSNQ
jgi:hypothetical protein